MIASHIHDALNQVERMRALVLERRRFRGYSGAARMAGGLAALAGAALLDSRAEWRTPAAQLAGWAIVLAAALLLNYGGLAARFLRRQAVGLSTSDFRPALEVLPALALGAALSLALVLRGQFDLLFGAWMSLYGLAHMGYRHSLPPGIIAVGLFYQAAGIACLLAPGVTFLNPWPMGLVFLAGECAGGWLLRGGLGVERPAGPADDPTDDDNAPKEDHEENP